MNYVGSEPAPAGVILVGDTNPIGAIAFFHSPPSSWLQLNGQVISKTGYPDLWAYAAGFLTADQVANPGLYKSIDAGTFAVPNLSGLFIRATGQVDASHVAAALGVKQADDNLSHLHLIDRFNNPGANTGNIAGGGASTGAVGAPDVKTSGGTEARPVNVGLVACVKALPALLIPSTTIPSQSGRLVQSRSHVRGDYLSQIGTIPFDDTIPQITEGAEFFTLANFTPQFVGSRVRVRCIMNGTPASTTGWTIALFRSGTPDALAVGMFVVTAANEGQLHIEHEFISASVAPFTYSIRAGASDASAIRLNGRATRNYGGACNSFLRMDEYSP